jgi:hypothetical protein
MITYHGRVNERNQVTIQSYDPAAARFADIVLLERRGLEITKHATGGNQQDTLARESRREFTGTEERRMLAPFAQERLCRDIGLSGDGGRGTGSQHQLDLQAQDHFPEPPWPHSAFFAGLQPFDNAFL